MSSPPLPPIEALLPHRGWMLLLTELREAGDGRALAAARVAPDGPLVDPEGNAPAILGLEMGAQCAGALEAAAHAAGGGDPRPATGYLVRIRSAKIAASSLPAGRELLVEARRTGGVGGLGIYQIQVVERAGGPPLVEASLATMASGAGRQER